MQPIVERISDALCLTLEAQRDAMRGDSVAVTDQLSAAMAVLSEALEAVTPT